MLVLVAASAGAAPPRLRSIEPRGVFLGECSLPGETRADDVVPGQAVAAQLSRDRWMIVYQTRGWRGVDDERSIVYQIRQGGPEGKVLKEGFLARTRNDWIPFEGAKKCVRQHGHPVLFGIPRGALIRGMPALGANSFVVLWRVVGVPFDAARNAVLRDDGVLLKRTQGVEWLQFRLNADESDIDIVQAARGLRQKGFETGPAFCSREVGWMNQCFVPPVPLNAACTQWALCNHFDGGRIGCLKFAFDAETKRYQWVETGPLVGSTTQPFSEASLLRQGKDWIVAARTGGKNRGVTWAKTHDPFKELPTPVVGKEPVGDAPLTAFRCADGALRLFTGDVSASPRRYARDPIYAWDVDADDGFRCRNRRMVFDSRTGRLAMRKAVSPRIDFAILMPPHAKKQLLTYRVGTRAYNFPYDHRPSIVPLNKEEKAACGIYYSVLTYDAVEPPPWDFNDGK
jgi:hypothetical protein